MKTILCIDGGGIRGLIPALVIAEIERRTGRPASQLFDLFVGTSTGGILALTLTVPDEAGAPKYGADAVADLYRRRGGEIFHRSIWHSLVTLGGLLSHRYDHRSLERVLQEYLGHNTPLARALRPVMVTSYDLLSRKPRFLKSFNPDHYALEMWRAARATSAAPTYFAPAPVSIGTGDTLLVDGGVFVNNPAASAYAEAVRGWPEEDDFLVVSLGTGSETDHYDFEHAAHWGMLAWLRPLISVVFDGESDAVDYQMDKILATRHIRLQIPLNTAAAMDDVSPAHIRALEDEARRLIEVHEADLARICARLTGGAAPGAAGA